MSTLQTLRPSVEHSVDRAARHFPLRLVLLCALFLLSIGFNVGLSIIAPPPDAPVNAFVTLWLVSFLPYGAACALVLLTRPSTGRLRWIELGLILLGALVLRTMLLAIPPDLSHDSWRYLWDARVTLHGYSPYVYGPGDPRFVSLRDFIYDNSRFRDAPTIYPPAAQAIYLLSYLLAPSNLFVLKGIFMLFELVTCGALAYLLYRRGMDPARCIIYAWCPLPIIEFAIQGHLDAATVTFSVLAIICARANWRGSRVVTGILIALAALTKIYPILLLLAVMRRRDWALLASCFVTIVLAYIPYLILGQGQVFGFFATYAGQVSPNAGVVQLVAIWLGQHLKWSKEITSLSVYAGDIILMGTVSLLTWRLRRAERISMEAAALLLMGAIFAVSTHVFPWYTTALLPWVAVLLRPLERCPMSVKFRPSSPVGVCFQEPANTGHRPGSLAGSSPGGENRLAPMRVDRVTRTNARTPLHWLRSRPYGRVLAAIMAWYFSCISIVGYFYDYIPDWTGYYLLAYTVTLIGLAVAAVIGVLHRRAILQK